VRRLLLCLAALLVAGCGTDAQRLEPAPGPAQAPGSTVLWAVGDGADGSAQGRQVARLIRRDRPDRFLYLGDVYERGTASEFRSNYSPVYGAFNRLAAPTPGNHEWGNRGTGYFPYWRRAKGRPQPSWYRFRAGGWEVISLNSEAANDSGSRQQRWLRRVVDRRPGTCRIAFMHRPYMSAGAYKPGTRGLRSVWRTLRGHARLVLAGHDHNMQRLRRRDGMNQYVSGAGGRERYRVDRRDRRLAFGRGDRFGALRVELTGSVAKLQFRSGTGRVLDGSEVRCRPLGG
jgi:Calcineurin-like phosphoesterase